MSLNQDAKDGIEAIKKGEIPNRNQFLSLFKGQGAEKVFSNNLRKTTEARATLEDLEKEFSITLFNESGDLNEKRIHEFSGEINYLMLIIIF